MKNVVLKFLIVIVTIATILCAVILARLVFMQENGEEITFENLFFISIENTKLTADNYDSIMEEYNEKHSGEDSFYYLSYDILVSTFTNGVDKSQFYGKTINDLIVEGKKKMTESNVTIEQYRESVEALNNIGNAIKQYNTAMNEINY